MASLILGAAPMATHSLKLPSRITSSYQSQIPGTPLALSSYSPSVSVTVSTISSPSSLPLVYCGRGDKKTKKGKRFNHSYGNARPRNKKKGRGPPRLPCPPAPLRKDKFDDGEKIHIEIDESLFSG